jgi:uracil phosphoribosyltransferase
MPKVTEVGHPLVRHHLTLLRDVHTPASEFRELVERLAVLLVYEAADDLELGTISVKTPLAVTDGYQLTQRIGLVPILRAGLGMVDPVLHLLPTAEVWHLGLYRDEETARPVEYYSKLPPRNPVDVAFVLDPMLATGGSASAALETLHKWGVRRTKVLSIIAAPEGIKMVQSHFPETQIYVCSVDEKLNEQKFIVPGLGDAGDRIFNTEPSAAEEELETPD